MVNTMTPSTHIGLVTQHKKILLVEDNPDDVELTLLAFSHHKMGNQVAVAWDGQDALNYLFGEDGQSSRAPHELPLLILLDLKLPKIDGVEVLRRLRANATTSLIPVVILTTSDEHPDMVNSYRSGANSYVRKPVDYVEFLGVVRQLGRYWIDINAVPN